MSNGVLFVLAEMRRVALVLLVVCGALSFFGVWEALFAFTASLATLLATITAAVIHTDWRAK